MYGTGPPQINYKLDTVGMNQILRYNPIWQWGIKMQGNTSAKLMGEIYSHSHKPGSSKFTQQSQKGRVSYASDIRGHLWVSKKRIWNPACDPGQLKKS